MAQHHVRRDLPEPQVSVQFDEAGQQRAGESDGFSRAAGRPAGVTAVILSPDTSTVWPASIRVPSNTRSATSTYRSPNRRPPGPFAAIAALLREAVSAGVLRNFKLR